MITAPYNFVPLNKEVFYPHWSNDGKEISHDIPFADGESGVIDIKITAKTPIFVRNHSEDKDNPSEEFCHFINQNGAKEYYIPGSSLKGMIRSVLEILSFSKIQIDEEKYKDVFGVRDMSNQKQLVGGANGCGFLIKKEDEYFVEDCGKILTISHMDLQKQFNNIKKLETAKSKYEEFGINDIKFETYQKMMDVRGKKIPKFMAKLSNDLSKIGTLVFTGNIGNKKHEFIFKTNGNTLALDKKVYKNFSKVYLENEDSTDGQFWKTKFKTEKRIPIFYIKEDGNIKHIGLTQLFKIAYNKSILEASKQDTNTDKIDLAQTIFGYVNKDKNQALKGRVQISNFSSILQRFEKEIEQVLGTPNPTYYPNYIRQTDTNGNSVNRYITLMDNNAQISGWKRYPLHNSIQSYPLPKNKEGKINHDVTTNFIPLSEGTVFKGKIRFHNLKKVEIGALLSAITFHGQNHKCSHNIGMAKSLGYGRIEIDIEKKDLKFNQKEYLEEFENTILKEIPTWKESSQLRELFAMANINTKSNNELSYQLLENPNPKYELNKRNPEKNDFTGAKKAKEFLITHSNSFTFEKKDISVNTSIEKKVEKQKIEPRKGGLKIVEKTQEKKTPQAHQSTHVQEYSIEQIAKEVGVKAKEVLDFIQNSTLPISKKLNSNSTLKESQAKNLINQMKIGK